MHELSIAHSLVETAVSEALRANARKVSIVRLRLGVLAGVVRGSLDFCYDLVARGTLLEGSRLVVEELPVVVFCPRCREEVPLPGIQCFRCPRCDTPCGEVRQGRELEIESIEIEC